MKIERGAILQGRYEIAARIGEGGVGRVYRAVDRISGTTVAVKLIENSGAMPVEVRERFRREWTNTIGLRHKNIVETLDYLRSDDVEAVVMEYVEKGDLRSVMRRPCILRDALPILRGILEGLRVIHERGIIHRDLKPENVLLTIDGAPKISDFGSSRYLDAASITQEGVWIATPLYIAPEYVELGEADERSDIFAWGVMAYQLLSGVPPYRSSDKARLIMERFTPPPRLEHVAPNISAAVADIVHKALSIRVVERYQDASEVIADMEKL